MQVDIKKNLLKARTYLIEAKSNGLKEADTVQRVNKFCGDVLGYDVLDDISTEMRQNNKFSDLILKIDNSKKVIIEVKQAGKPLKPSHIDQAQAYASTHEVPWVVLTNGTTWNLYHLTNLRNKDIGILKKEVFSIDLTEESGIAAACSCLGNLHKQAVRRGSLETLPTRSNALTSKSIQDALCSEEVLMVMRRQIRKKHGPLVSVQEILQTLDKMLVKPSGFPPLALIRARRKSSKRKSPLFQAGSQAQSDGLPSPGHPHETNAQGETSPVIVVADINKAAADSQVPD